MTQDERDKKATIEFYKLTYDQAQRYLFTKAIFRHEQDINKCTDDIMKLEATKWGNCGPARVLWLYIIDEKERHKREIERLKRMLKHNKADLPDIPLDVWIGVKNTRP